MLIRYSEGNVLDHRGILKNMAKMNSPVSLFHVATTKSKNGLRDTHW